MPFCALAHEADIDHIITVFFETALGTFILRSDLRSGGMFRPAHPTSAVSCDEEARRASNQNAPKVFRGLRLRPAEFAVVDTEIRILPHLIGSGV